MEKENRKYTEERKRKWREKRKERKKKRRKLIEVTEIHEEKTINRDE